MIPLTKEEMKSIHGKAGISESGSNTYCYCMDGHAVNGPCHWCHSWPCLHRGGAKGVCITFEDPGGIE